MSAGKTSKKLDMYRTTDFRRELTFREKKVAEIKREKMKILADGKPVPKFMITVDLSHARGNLDAVRLCLKELEWKEYPFGRKDQNCDIHWHCTNFEQNPDLYGGTVNKFPGMQWTCSKMNLFRVLDHMRSLFPDDYDFYPRTWYLPEQLHQLAHDIRKMNEKKSKPKPTFIVKPDSGSQGEGIYLLRDVQDYMNNGRTNVCQEYLNKVFLIDRYKFDLRVYAVLKSVEPLEIYVCKEGLARFSTVPYESPTHKNLHETFMHLTNYSLNKRSVNFNRSEREDEGSKRTLTSVFNRMKRLGFNTDKLWQRIEKIIVKTIIAIIPDLKIEMQSALPANKPGPSCFQILGFDILLLQNLKPMLLEINASPSLCIDSEVEISPGVMEHLPSPKDEEVKIPLIRDTLLLVAPQKKLRYLQRWKEKHARPIAFVLPIECQKRRRARREKRRQIREEEERQKQEIEEKRMPSQVEKDGVIHVETNHPRSSIVIIRADENDEKPKKLNRESSFVLPNIHNAIKNFEETDYFNKKSTDHNSNEVDKDDVEQIPLQPYKERTEYVDHNSEEDGKLPNSHIEPVQSEELLQKDDSCTSSNQNDARTLPSVNANDQEDDVSSEAESVVDTESGQYESCLKMLYPLYEEKFEYLRLYEKLADIFMISLGVRATLRLGPTGFRTFARKCRLNKKGLTNAAIDILFIDIQRKWEHVNPERTTAATNFTTEWNSNIKSRATGLCFRGFLEACHEIARRKFLNGDLLQTMEEFIDYCEENIREEQGYSMRSAPRLLYRRARPHGYPLLEPMMATVQNAVVEEHSGIYLDSRLNHYLKPTSAEDVDNFLRRHRQLDSITVSRSGSRVKSRLKNSED